MAKRKSKSTSTSTSTSVNACRKFESLHEFSTWIETTRVHESFEARESSRKEERATGNFYGTRTYEEASNLMLNGWDSGASDVSKIMLERSSEFERVKRLSLDYAGAVPCVPAYLSGSPANMIAIKKRPTTTPVITLCYSLSISSDETSNEILLHSAKLLNVIRGLEAGGCKINLYVGMFAKRWSDVSCYITKIKDSKEPFNVLNMAYPLIHPSFLRRQGFAYTERCGVDYSKGWSNYGSVLDDLGKQAEITESLGIVNPVCVDYYSLKSKNEAEITEMIKRQAVCDK